MPVFKTHWNFTQTNMKIILKKISGVKATRTSASLISQLELQHRTRNPWKNHALRDPNPHMRRSLLANGSRTNSKTTSLGKMPSWDWLRPLERYPNPLRNWSAFEIEPEKVIHRIMLQNTGICTNNWRSISTKNEPYGLLLVVRMDKYSWMKLAELEYRPFLPFSRVHFKRLGREADSGRESL